MALALALLPAVAGAYLDPSVVRRGLAPGMPRMRACYERATAVDPSLAGRVVVRFTIGPDGRVTRSEVTEAAPAGLAPVGACVAGVIATLQFVPPRVGSVTVNYPFVFQPEGVRVPTVPTVRRP